LSDVWEAKHLLTVFCLSSGIIQFNSIGVFGYSQLVKVSFQVAVPCK
jgi:hypothetical protein